MASVVVDHDVKVGSFNTKAMAWLEAPTSAGPLIEVTVPPTGMIPSARHNNLSSRRHPGKGMRMRFRTALLVAIPSALFGVADADGFKPPPTRDGLWETHTSQTQQSKTVVDTSIKTCMSSELTKSMQSKGEELRKRNQCTSTVTQPSPNSYVEQSRCAKGPNAGTDTRIVYTYQGDTAYRMEMHMNPGNSEKLMIMDAKYLGSCPAGMKAGDSIMPDGKIIAVGN